MKTCSKCSASKAETEFYSQAANRDGLKGWCKACVLGYSKLRRETMTPERRNARNEKEKLRKRARSARDRLNPDLVSKRLLGYRNRNLKRRFGLGPENWSALLHEQNGVCAICNEVPTGKKGFCVDHNHTTGQVRGLLCAQCNAALGMLKESVSAAESLIRYINKHSKPSV